MKKIILIFVILITTLFAKIDEYKTDIYYGNGVFNTKEMAKDNLNELQERIINKEIIKGNPKLLKKYGEVKLAYNWEKGYMDDILETYYQLKEAGQVSHLDFFAVMMALTRGNLKLSEQATARLIAAMPYFKKVEQSNVNEMLQKYKKESLSKSHRVLLVSHSQGNLFANRIYDSLNPKDYQEYFANLQVATPADKVHALLGLHVTLFGDPIINPIPNSLSSNVKGDMGHEFISAYLHQKEPSEKIISDLKKLLPLLDKTISQWQTKEELNYGTQDYRITVKHRFDPTITVDTEVFPFDPSKKLYFIEDPYSTYVKGGFGGTQIQDENSSLWTDRQPNQYYKLEGTDPV